MCSGFVYIEQWSPYKCRGDPKAPAFSFPDSVWTLTSHSLPVHSLIHALSERLCHIAPLALFILSGHLHWPSVDAQCWVSWHSGLLCSSPTISVCKLYNPCSTAAASRHFCCTEVYTFSPSYTYQLSGQQAQTSWTDCYSWLPQGATLNFNTLLQLCSFLCKFRCKIAFGSCNLETEVSYTGDGSVENDNLGFYFFLNEVLFVF